jgi:hypothetical protein
MKPPTDVPPSALFLKLLEPEPSEEIDFPRYNADGTPVGKLRVRVLAQEDHDRARLKGEAAILAKGKTREDLTNPATREVVADTIAREVLAVACMTAEELTKNEKGQPVYGRVFRDADDLLKIRPDELAVLFAAYQMVQAKYGPYESCVSEDDVTAWIKRLEAGATALPFELARLPRSHELTLSLARRAYTLSAVLDGLWPSLPDTCKSRLTGFGLGTGSFGELAATSTTDGGESSVDEPVTTEAAARVAEAMKD